MIILPGTLLAAKSVKETTPAPLRNVVHIPAITTVGYNGRRGDGSLPSQGWTQISGGTFTPTAQTDGNGGYWLHITKNPDVVWDISHPASEHPEDLVRFGGRLFCRFRLTGAMTEGRYAFAFYLKVAASELPSGVTLSSDGSPDMSPTLMNFSVMTLNGRTTLCQHKGQRSGMMVEVANWGAHDNNWHTMELIYPGNNSVKVTPVLDGVKKSPVTLSLSAARVPQDTIYLTSITRSTVYVTDVASFEGQIYRDSGEYTLTPDDNGSTYFFPAGYHRGKIIIPDRAFPQGFSVSIPAQGATVTLHPESSAVLLQPPGSGEAYPVDAVISSNVRLLQSGADGKSWVVT